jgi:hypothetical protein
MVMTEDKPLISGRAMLAIAGLAFFIFMWYLEQTDAITRTDLGFYTGVVGLFIAVVLLFFDQKNKWKQGTKK